MYNNHINERKLRRKGGEVPMKKSVVIILIVVLIIAVVLGITTCGKNKEEPTKEVAVATEAPTPAPATPAPTEAPKEESAPAYTDALAKIRALLNEGKYYEAAQAIAACRETYPESAAECDELWEQIRLALADRRPESGELERTFKYFGGNRIEISSESGDVDMTVTARNGEGYARYYVREGETASFYLPCYSFDVNYKVGDIWFDDEIGFGEFCEESYVNGPTFKYADVPGWVIFHFAEGNPEVQSVRDNIVPARGY